MRLHSRRDKIEDYGWDWSVRWPQSENYS